MSTNVRSHFRPYVQRWVGAFFFSLLSLLANAAPGDIKVEAEAATLNGVSIVSTQAGYSGTGYAWNFDNATDNIVFPVSVPIAGEYELTLVYYSPYGDKNTLVNVNGASKEQTLTGSGTNFGSVKVGKYTLTAGVNSVTLTNDWGYYGIDYIVFSPVSVTPPKVAPNNNGRIEAEAGDLAGTELSTTPAGFSGTGYVTSFDNATDKVTLTFNATAGLYDLAIGYTSPYGPKGFDIQVNDDKGSGMFTATTDAAPFSSVKAGKFLMKEGLNTVILNRGWGYFGIDYIQLTPTSVPLPVKPPKTLVDSKATPSTRSLFSYMVDMYGSKVFSGQHDDIDYIQQTTGKEPAIAAWDLIEYSPSRVENGSNPTGQTESHIAWAKKNEGRGIVSMIWHWNAPTDLINQAPDKLWWRGFYTDATTFDLAAVLADKSGSRYQLLLRDIDVIAAELKKFQAADVPVIWRPLHEAPGGWFWWGAKGSGPFKELWHIMYDRLTNQHNLHNLIWVWTGTDTINMDWYPGDQYVDVVSEDIYTDPAANLSGNWENAQSQFNGKKLVALSESGNLDKPDYIRGFGTWWSWFSVWTGTDYIRKQPVELLKAVYNDKDIITRDELPDWRTYGQLSLTAPTYNCQTGAITFNSTGGDGTPVQYMAIGIKVWSTDPNGVVDAAVRNDPKIIQLMAKQGDLITTFAFDLPNACQQTPQPGGTFALLPPTYNCSTGAITFRTSGGNGGAIEYMAVGIKSWSADPDGIIEAGLRGDPKPVTLLARQNGVTVQYDFDLQTACPTTITQPVSPTTNGALTMLAPTYNCSTGAITFNAQGGNGTPIEYMAVGIKPWSINPYGIVEPGLRGDPKVVQLLARQGDVVVSYTFDLPNACPAVPARRAAEPTAELRLTILGNPAQRELTVDITGAAGQPLQLILTDLQGRQIHNQHIDQPANTERVTIPVGHQPAGMLLLRANTSTQTRAVKVVKE